MYNLVNVLLYPFLSYNKIHYIFYLGIGPAYGSKTMRNGLRVGDLKDMKYFEQRLRTLVKQLEIAYPGI